MENEKLQLTIKDITSLFDASESEIGPIGDPIINNNDLIYLLIKNRFYNPIQKMETISICNDYGYNFHVLFFQYKPYLICWKKITKILFVIFFYIVV